MNHSGSVCLASLTAPASCPNVGACAEEPVCFPSHAVPGGLCSQACTGPACHSLSQKIVEDDENLPGFQDSISQECLAVCGLFPNLKAKGNQQTGRPNDFPSRFGAKRFPCPQSPIFWCFLPKLTESLAVERERPQGLMLPKEKGHDGKESCKSFVVDTSIPLK